MEKPIGFDMTELKGMMPVCSWTTIDHVISVSTWFIFSMYIEHLGERSHAVSNIVRGVSGLLWMVTEAFASTCSTLVSNIIGAGREDKVWSLLKRILKLSYSVVMSCALLFCIFPSAVISIYTDIPDLIPSTIPSMLVMCSSYLFTVGAMVLFQAVSGTGSTKAAFRLEMAALAIYTLYCTVIVGILKLDIAICWTAEHVYAIALLILCYTYMHSGHWKHRKI
jgi:Na+-driven multidrug efflux pump